MKYGMRHSPSYITILALLCGALAFSGCSLSRQAKTESEPEIITSALQKPMKAQGIDATDARVITDKIASGMPQATESAPALAWSNPENGNRGTIMAIDNFVGSGGQDCRKFRTTVDSFSGIAVYDGEACRNAEGKWVLSDFRRN